MTSVTRDDLNTAMAALKTSLTNEVKTVLKELIEGFKSSPEPAIVVKPTVSDSEYDKKYDELVRLEKESGIVLFDSPTRRVGGEPVSAFKKHEHIHRLYSLDKCVTEEQLEAFDSRIRKVTDPVSTVEYKFDGLTINLTYENGMLVRGATRGNGVVGEAILPQIRTIRSIPLTIPFKGRMEVQGECYMRLSVLDELNRAGEDQLKNARNAAAGALRNLDPKVTARRRLDCYFYN